MKKSFLWRGSKERIVVGGARTSLGDVHAPSDEVAHELEAQW